jgi:hypothetical protein
VQAIFKRRRGNSLKFIYARLFLVSPLLRHTFIFAADDAVLKHTGKFEGEIIF